MSGNRQVFNSSSRKGQNTLSESEQVYRQIIELAEEGIWYAKPDGVTIFVNNKMAEMLGYSPEEFVGRIGADFLAKGYENEVIQTRRLLAENKRIQKEIQFQRKDGKLIWTLSKVAPVFDEKGEHVANISMHTDITQRKRAEDALKQRARSDLTQRKKVEQALKQSEQRYIQLFNSVPDGFVVVRPIYDNSKIADLVYLDVNPAFESLVGKTREQIVGKKVTQVLDTVEDYWFKPIDQVAKTGKAVSYEDYIESLQKYQEVFAWKAAPNQIGILFTDITCRKNLEKQLQEKERMAAIGETAGMVGHDLRNPLQAIEGEVFLLKSELEAMPESQSKAFMKESLEGISEQINYMDKIVSDLQTFVKQVVAHKQIVNLKELTNSTLAAVKVPNNVQTSIDMEDKLLAEVDPQLLKRVLINLITNSIQAMPLGGELTIQSCDDGKGHVRIVVGDTGEGILDEIKPKIFTPLFTTKSKGQGFGLAVCKRVIEAQGGTIYFESQAGKGTNFIVELPILKNV